MQRPYFALWGGLLRRNPMKKKKTAAIYARVSTSRQKFDLQVEELKKLIQRSGWKLYKVYVDEGFSGKDTKRPAFNEMMIAAQRREFEILTVWKFDRLSRSLKDLVTTLEELDSLGIDFMSHENHLDTSTPSGKLVFQVIAAVAEFERDIIVERVKAGMANAKRKGKHVGRPRIPDHVLEEARKLRKEGKSWREIGKALGVDPSGVRKRLKG